MQERNNTNNDGSRQVADTIDVSKSKGWERRVAFFFVIVALVGLLVCAGLLIHAYITHKPTLELLVVPYNVKPGFELLGYSAEVFYIAGYLTLIIAAGIYALGSIKQKQLSYIPGFILND